MLDDASSAGVYRERFDSTDLAEVEDHLSAAYAAITLRHTGEPARFVHRHDTVGTGRFAVSRMRTSAGYGARLDGLHGTFVVATVRTGGFASSSGCHGELGAGSGDTALTPPACDVAWVSDPIDVDLVALDGAAVAACAATSPRRGCATSSTT